MSYCLTPHVESSKDSDGAERGAVAEIQKKTKKNGTTVVAACRVPEARGEISGADLGH